MLRSSFLPWNEPNQQKTSQFVWRQLKIYWMWCCFYLWVYFFSEPEVFLSCIVLSLGELKWHTHHLLKCLKITFAIQLLMGVGWLQESPEVLGEHMNARFHCSNDFVRLREFDQLEDNGCADVTCFAAYAPGTLAVYHTLIHIDCIDGENMITMIFLPWPSTHHHGSVTTTIVFQVILDYQSGSTLRGSSQDGADLRLPAMLHKLRSPVSKRTKWNKLTIYSHISTIQPTLSLLLPTHFAYKRGPPGHPLDQWPVTLRPCTESGGVASRWALARLAHVLYDD